MATLEQDLKTRISSLTDFREISERVLNYMAEVINEDIGYLNYRICSSTFAGMKKTVRPFNQKLFLRDISKFDYYFKQFEKIIYRLKNRESKFSKVDFETVDKVTYTLQQSIGIGLDLVVDPNSARKHVGIRFEELMKSIFTAINISNKKIVLKIPYETYDGVGFYRCETDMVISPFDSIKSNSQYIDSKEVVISLKTTTKDRMPKIFIDKILMERFLGKPIRIVGISQNDIQRKDDKGKPKISFTFVPNLFMVYTEFLARLDGYYYVDRPKRAYDAPFNKYIFSFSDFLLKDVWSLLNS